MAARDKEVVGLTRRFAGRVSRVVTAAEGTPKNSAPTLSSGAPWTYAVASAKVTTAITPGSFDTPSSAGRAQIYWPDASGAWVASGDPVVVHNRLSLGGTSVAVDKAVFLCWQAGLWFLLQADCP